MSIELEYEDLRPLWYSEPWADMVLAGDRTATTMEHNPLPHWSIRKAEEYKAYQKKWRAEHPGYLKAWRAKKKLKSSTAVTKKG